jgi:hypothetical protein
MVIQAEQISVPGPFEKAVDSFLDEHDDDGNSFIKLKSWKVQR